MKEAYKAAARIAVFLAVAFAFSFGLPLYHGPSSTSSVFNTLLLFSFLAGFFINRALERRKTIRTSIETELARLRRLYNFSISLDDRAWGVELHHRLAAYHRRLAENLFLYRDGRDDYRLVVQWIYSFAPNSERDRILFHDLLATTRDIGLERRPLERSLDGGLSAQSWAVFLMIAASVVVLVLLNRGNGMTEFSSGLTAAGIIAVLDLLNSTDRVSKEEIAGLQQMYRDNVPSD
jgi:hypothetical protein